MSNMGKRVLRWLGRIALFLLAGLLLLTVVVVADGWQGFGQAPTGERLARMQRSPQYGDGVFQNPQPMWNDPWGMFSVAFDSSPVAEPTAPVPVMATDPGQFAVAPESGLRLTWLGHSTTIIEIDGQRVLTDPIFGGRASPVSWAGPEVWYAPPLAFDALPTFDAVLISHDHYDHLQEDTVRRMAGWDTTFITPLGVGAHLEYWGVPRDRIVELDWWESHTVGDLTIVSTPSRHASGRQVFDQMRTLWTSYVLKGSQHRVFFSGDTGLFPGLHDIGERFGPFDLVMLEVGAYNRAWPDWHLGPEQALVAHDWLRGQVLMPIHWGLWNLAAHGWTEPVERLLLDPRAAHTALAIPRPGGSFEPAAVRAQGAGLHGERWWPKLPFQTAAQHPVVATRVPGVSPPGDPRVQ